jgi:hypothetical protein
LARMRAPPWRLTPQARSQAEPSLDRHSSIERSIRQPPMDRAGWRDRRASKKTSGPCFRCQPLRLPLMIHGVKKHVSVLSGNRPLRAARTDPGLTWIDYGWREPRAFGRPAAASVPALAHA